MKDIKGKWAMITGSSRGIGYQTALMLADYGCNLILHSRNLENTTEILKKVKEKGVSAYAVVAEMSDIDSVKLMLDDIENHETEIDILINNAAVQVAYRENYWNTPCEDFTKSFVINMIAPAMICYRLIPKMIHRGFGRIVNVTSGIQDEPEQAAYSASKAALDKFTNDLAGPLNGTDVMIYLVDPGWCRTDLGGPKAPNSVESSLPGVIVGIFLDDQQSPKMIRAQEYAGMNLVQAVQKAEKIYAQ